MSAFGGRCIRTVDMSADSFRNSFAAVKDANLRAEILSVIRLMLGQDLDTAPRAWHMHQLTNKDVPSRQRPGVKVPAWTLHVTSDDVYKASFTLEDGCAHMRLVDTHKVIDKRP